MSACCRIGGLAGGLDAESVEALATYGERIGIAFQIIDDSLDFVADPGAAGQGHRPRPREGKRTLPLIVTLDRATADERARILEALGRPGLLETDVAEVHRLVKVYDGVGYAVGRALAYAETGVAALDRVPGVRGAGDPDPHRRVRDPSGSMTRRRGSRRERRDHPAHGLRARRRLRRHGQGRAPHDQPARPAGRPDPRGSAPGHPASRAAPRGARGGISRAARCIWRSWIPGWAGLAGRSPSRRAATSSSGPTTGSSGSASTFRGRAAWC